MNNFEMARSIALLLIKHRGYSSLFFCSMYIVFVLIAYKNFNQQGLTNHSPPKCGLNKAKVHLDLESHPQWEQIKYREFKN